MHLFKIKTGYQFYWQNIKAIFTHKQFMGWGRKKTGRFATWCAQMFNGTATLYEDGFIRSIGLGVNGAPSFSMVSDDVGIYYDASQPSRLENILNFSEWSYQELEQAQAAIKLITANDISKYNYSPKAPNNYFAQDKKIVLVIAQTAGDASLKYGLGDQFSTHDILRAAINENAQAEIYIKLHPDVLSGKKNSDVSLKEIPKSCKIISDNFNPISLLKQVDKVYTKTSQMGFEALLLNKQVVCFGMPFYAGWGLTDDRVELSRRQAKCTVQQVFAAAYLQYTAYFNPYSNKHCDIFEVIDVVLQHRKRYINAPQYGYFFGFSRWKHGFIKPFFSEIHPAKQYFINPIWSTAIDLAKRKGLVQQAAQAAIYIWGKQQIDGLSELATQYNIPVYQVEDGFVRSVSLGSDLTQPYSLVVDQQGIYFDPNQPSDLETILAQGDLRHNSKLLAQAKSVRNYMVEHKVSKYNLFAQCTLNLPQNKTIILVPGQVADDASLQYGAQGLSNLTLLQTVHSNCPQAHIIYKPHPDVLVGNRVGHIPEHTARLYCHQVVTEVSIDSILQHPNVEVHTMTSLVGFEALLRGKKVVTYGMPFYAGWGLTQDHQHNPRRGVPRSLDELVAATLLKYPRYIHPTDRQACDLEAVFAGLAEQQQRLANNAWLRAYWTLRNGLVRRVLKSIKTVASLKGKVQP